MLNKLKKILIGAETEQKTTASASFGLTNQELVDKVVLHFQQRMTQESTDVTLLYPTSFYIYLNEQDYHGRSEAFAFLVNDFVYKFNELIRQRQTNYIDYHPHARYWQFQFVEFSENSQVEGFGTEGCVHPLVPLSEDGRDIRCQRYRTCGRYRPCERLHAGMSPGRELGCPPWR